MQHLRSLSPVDQIDPALIPYSHSPPVDEIIRETKALYQSDFRPLTRPHLHLAVSEAPTRPTTHHSLPCRFRDHHNQAALTLATQVRAYDDNQQDVLLLYLEEKPASPVMVGSLVEVNLSTPHADGTVESEYLGLTRRVAKLRGCEQRWAEFVLERKETDHIHVIIGVPIAPGWAALPYFDAILHYFRSPYLANTYRFAPRQLLAWAENPNYPKPTSVLLTSILPDPAAHPRNGDITDEDTA